MSDLHAEILTIEGPDAIAFTHAQLSSDVHALQTGAWQWSAWLNPQGRVRALLQVMRPEEYRLHLLLRGGHAAAMAAALKPYVFRSRVTLTAREPGILASAPPRPAGSMHVDGDDVTLGMGEYAMCITPAGTDATQPWRRQAIHAGHPWLPDSVLDNLLAPSLSLQQLGAVSLDKGCYPGQEIVARLHYRGGCKQHLRHVRAATRPAPGATLSINGKTIGVVLDSVCLADGDSRALAVMHDTVADGEIRAGIDNALEKIYLSVG